LHRTKLRETRKQTLSAEVIHAAVVYGESGVDREIVEIDTEFGVVPSNAPGKIVGELIAFFNALDVGEGSRPK
jgi:hypothetical protein